MQAILTIRREGSAFALTLTVAGKRLVSPVTPEAQLYNGERQQLRVNLVREEE